VERSSESRSQSEVKQRRGLEEIVYKKSGRKYRWRGTDMM
jgi:hypothetical protein